jgi:hypothetical protein
MNHVMRFLNHIAILDREARAIVFNHRGVPVARTERMPPEFALKVVEQRFPEGEVLYIKPWQQCTLDEQRLALKPTCPLHALKTAADLINQGILEISECCFMLKGLEAVSSDQPGAITEERLERALDRRRRFAKC